MPYGASELASEVAQVRDRHLSSRAVVVRSAQFGVAPTARLGALPSLALRPSVSRRPEPSS